MSVQSNSNNAEMVSSNNVDMMSSGSSFGSYLKVDESTVKIATSVLKAGEYAGMLKYAKYVPGSPRVLSHKAFQIVGDLCSMGLSAIAIKTKIDKFLDEKTPKEEKVKLFVEISKITFALANNGLFEKLPLNSTFLKKLNQTIALAETAMNIGNKVQDLQTANGSLLATTKSELEVGILGISALKTTLDLVEQNSLLTNIALSTGSGALSVAKAGVSALETTGHLIGIKA